MKQLNFILFEYAFASLPRASAQTMRASCVGACKECVEPVIFAVREAVWCVRRAVWCVRRAVQCRFSVTYRAFTVRELFLVGDKLLTVATTSICVCNDIPHDIPECDPPCMYVRTYILGENRSWIQSLVLMWSATSTQPSASHYQFQPSSNHILGSDSCTLGGEHVR